MPEDKITFRVRYAEVDRMGYAHHGNYAAYFEMGRTELMRKAGVVYKELEDQGIILPLSEFSVNYYKPALYDDELILVTKLEPPAGVRLVFKYFLYNSANELLAEGITPLVFVDRSTRKPIRPPKEIIRLLDANFKIE
ncbi:MAG: acyl-CoA thioesterase [Bacteroidota bacterium]|nr:MAG: acyl-CoA thioesterase [Bacteroidota bacterium]